MAKDSLTVTANIDATPREIDFVTQFARNWQHLMDIIGIMRPIKKTPGAILKSKEATLTLQDGSVGEGEEIPYSQAEIKETTYEEMTVEKYAKAVSIEAIKDNGYDVAVALTDDAFLYELQSKVTTKFYNYLNTGTLTGSKATWQMAMAMAQGEVINKFNQMHRTMTGVVAFVNVLDVYEYIGAANITVQNEFGFNYMKNFMGYNTVFMLSDSEIQRGRVIATPVENICLYYVDPSDSDFVKAGLQYTTDGDTNLIGFHTQGNYTTAVSEAFAIMGMTLFAEYLDAIAVMDVAASDDSGDTDTGTTASVKPTENTEDNTENTENTEAEAEGN